MNKQRVCLVGFVVCLLVMGGAVAQVSVPNVVGQAKTTATSTLTSAGLTVGTTTYGSSATQPVGRVYRQNPAAGTSVASGSAVDIVVAQAPSPAKSDPVWPWGTNPETSATVMSFCDAQQAIVDNQVLTSLFPPEFSSYFDLFAPDTGDVNGSSYGMLANPYPSGATSFAINGNGVNDCHFELRLIGEALANTSLNIPAHDSYTGLSHTKVLNALNANYEQMEQDFSSTYWYLMSALANGFPQVTLGHLIIGDGGETFSDYHDVGSPPVSMPNKIDVTGSAGFVALTMFLSGAAGFITNPQIDLADYVRMPEFFSMTGDADGDGYNNQSEYDYVNDTGRFPGLTLDQRSDMYAEYALSPMLYPLGNQPTPDFSAMPRKGVFPLSVAFTDASTAPSGHTITGWSWNFGDGHTSSEANPTHVYESAGSFSVTLTATNDAGSNWVTKANYVQVVETAVTPGVGYTRGGDTVNIFGTGFSSSGTTRVTFGGVYAPYATVVYDSAYNYRYVRCTSPAHAAGPADVVVINPDSSTQTFASAFTYIVAPPPEPTSVVPSEGYTLGGAWVYIYGTGFDAYGTTRVTFGGVDATYIDVYNGGYTGSYIYCRTPAHAEGAVDVTVINADGSSGTLTNGFTYVGPPVPNPVQMAPNQGLSTGSQWVYVVGSGFMDFGTTRVLFDGTDASGVEVSEGGSGDDYIYCMTPPHAAGVVDVTVINSGGNRGTLVDGFTYTQAAVPAPTSISPASGMSTGGETVGIYGTGFSVYGTVRVLFDGIEATYTDVYDYGYGSLYVSCVVPPHPAGVVDVEIINPDGGSGTLTGGYTYLSAGEPVLTGIDPGTGPANGGTAVFIYGSNFSSYGTTRVLFGGEDATNVSVYESGYYGAYVYCETPPHTAGVVDVVVINPDGSTATLSGGFTFVAGPAPIPTGVVPPEGGVAGGTAVEISGLNFAALGTVIVKFDGVEATNVAVYGHHIICATPAHAEGPVDVTVTNPDGQTGTVPYGFTYLASGNVIARVDIDNTSGTEDGTTWATAFRSIQAGVDAVAASGLPGEVWVAEGVYTTTGQVVVTMNPFCDIYGGFAATETARAERNVETHITIIDGEDAHACVYGADNARVDGFTITNGNGPVAVGTDSDWFTLTGALLGSAYDPDHMVCIDNMSASPILANCTITNNSSFIVMANLTNDTTQCSPLIMNCTFSENATPGNGVILNGSMNGVVANPRIHNCVFEDNGSPIVCMAITDGNCSPSVSRCIFSGSSGAAVSCFGASSSLCAPRIENSLFIDGGNALYALAYMDTTTSPSFVNCTFSDNAGTRALFYCVGDGASSPSVVTVKNSIIWGNGNSLITGSSYIPVEMSHCDVQGGFPGAANINADPVFASGGYKIRGESPCVDTGMYEDSPAEDLRGFARPQFAGVDMGAYECTVHANFGATAALGNVLEVHFSDASASTQSALASRSWDFGDSNTSTDVNPVHTYASTGTYTVVLDVASADDAATYTRALHVIVGISLSIRVHPSGGHAVPGHPYSMTVVTEGGIGEIHYSWKKDGLNAPYNVDSATYEINCLTADDDGVYTCEVSDDYQVLVSNAADLVVITGAMPMASAMLLAFLVVIILTVAVSYLRYRLRETTNV